MSQIRLRGCLMFMEHLEGVAETNGTLAELPVTAGRSVRAATWADEPLGLALVARPYVRRVLPEHWSFMLGEIALWSFVVLLLGGVFLSLWFDPSMADAT